ncbi:unnamed protein product [Rotaria sp. Silwood1]|nr:unnamed protein product [Rotaria sp. Silwood1]CAF0864829.1 unnamed protein product [Rotaria sp. Silwood1]CAF4782239.1 unnamed protein product [Rotaria sp. Silwood1]
MRKETYHQIRRNVIQNGEIKNICICHIAVRRLADLLLHKTNYVENNSEHLNSILEHFHIIDAQCQSSLKTLEQNRELTSSKMVAQFTRELNEVESKNDNIISSTMFTKSSEV